MLPAGDQTEIGEKVMADIRIFFFKKKEGEMYCPAPIQRVLSVQTLITFLEMKQGNIEFMF